MSTHTRDSLSSPRARGTARELSAVARPLPNLFVRSFALISVLYGALALLLITSVQFGFITAGAALLTGILTAAVQFVVGPWILDLTLRFLYRIEWVSLESLPAHARTLVERVCTKHRFRTPSFGIIPDGAPQAFTYGHHPSNARLVVSRGILELLTPDEIDAVVAHELGHVRHWDMVVMTIAQVVPLVAYYIYRAAVDLAEERGKARAPALLVALGAYVVFILSELTVLWFSRTREYYADQFAARETNNPNALSAALVTIGYGLARGGAATSAAPGMRPQRSASGPGFAPLNIFDQRAALNLVVSTQAGTRDGDFNRDVLQGALQWDLWNPWATFFEVQSTHPLIAKRLELLAAQAQSLGQTPLVVFDRKKPESYWDEFFIDLVVTVLPALGLLLGVAILGVLATTGNFNPRWLGSVFALTGLAFLLKVRMAYRADRFPERTVAELLQEVKVSPVRPVPTTISGTIIGKGVPGLIWSEDFVVRDSTGIIFLDYRQPFGLWEWLFGLLRAGSYQGKRVTVTGWFRRSPVPFIEISTIEAEGASGARRCYVRPVKVLVGLALVGLGVWILTSS
jgi:Zn-dependent protease with chaperone function